MITGRNINIYDFAAFAAAFQKAADGVLFVQGADVMGTGWLITDDLLIVPHYVAFVNETETKKLAGFFNDDPGTAVEIIPLPFNYGADANAENKVALCRLGSPATGRAASLCLNKLNTHDDAFILQYVEGKKNLNISSGNILSVDEETIRYDADTMPGSGGSPVLNGLAQVIGMHTRKYAEGDHAHNGGPSLTAIIAQLKFSAEWPEIAGFHNIAGAQEDMVQQVVKMQDIRYGNNTSLLLGAALQWHINPAHLSEPEQAQLKPYIIDAHPEKWTMKLEERRRIITDAGSLGALQKAHGIAKNASDGDLVIARILDGPPYNLHNLPEKDLPYWLQAVRWFGDAIKGLPKPADISLALEQKRHRSRLRVVAGPDFKGRKQELAFIQKWYDEQTNGPLLLTGIGGMGKSSLISKFILDLPPDSVFFWLDFDRADLSPDDAESVLDKISEQAFVQIAGFQEKERATEDWTANTHGLAESIAKLLPAKSKTLMVLDGFEVAQHVKKYNEIWKVLEDLLKHLPGMKVIVSGRATVKSLQLNGRDAVPLPLKGMDDESATGWLNAHGIKEKGIVSEVLRISKGVPLILRLASRLVENGGDVLELPKTLPESMVEGYLYQRILDRVIDPALHPLAKDVLVVRRFTVSMLEEVFKESLPQGMTATEVFERLMREMSLVNEADSAASIAVTEGTSVLFLRPEVRSATLKMLEQDSADHVQKIHNKAVAWYERQDTNEVCTRSELIYHYLHLREIDKAKALWRDDCILWLADADRDFSESNIEAAKWLSGSVQNASAAVAVETWEHDAAKRIITAMQRRQERIIPEILKEQDKRSAASVLIPYDALMLMRQGKYKAANELLETRKQPEGTSRQAQNIVQALNARYLGDLEQADACLMQLEQGFGTDEKEPWTSTRLLVRAARIKLNVLTDKEIALIRLIDNERFYNTDILKKTIAYFTTPADVIIPRLCEYLNTVGLQESYTSLQEVPNNLSELHNFKKQLNKKRAISLTSVPEKDEDIIAEGLLRAELEKHLDKAGSLLKDDYKQLVLTLAIGGFKKWLLATSDLFLSKAAEYQFSETSLSNDSSKLAVLGALAALRGEQLGFPINSRGSYNSGTDEFIMQAIKNSKSIYSVKLSVNDAALENAFDVLELENESKHADLLRKFLKKQTTSNNQLPFEWFMELHRPAIFSTLFHILGPDPLEVLCRQALGLAEDFEL